jgi:multisubunit Na+/H+ antiporter MnhC subunit
VTAALYALDKLQFFMNQEAMERFIKQQMSGNESALQAQGIDSMLIMQAMALTSVVIVFCWWGFALYTYWRRDYFKNTGTS